MRTVVGPRIIGLRGISCDAVPATIVIDARSMDPSTAYRAQTMRRYVSIILLNTNSRFGMKCDYVEINILPDIGVLVGAAAFRQHCTRLHNEVTEFQTQSGTSLERQDKFEWIRRLCEPDVQMNVLDE